MAYIPYPRIALGALALTAFLSSCDSEKGATGPAGTDGQSCSAKTIDEGVLVTCGSNVDTLFNGATGATGATGAGCSAKSLDEGLEITCGTVVIDTLAAGVNGQNGTDGDDGKDGTACSVTDNGDGTLTQTCGTQTAVTWNKATCGATAFEPGTHFCFDLEIYAKCGTATFNPGTHFCDTRDQRLYKYIVIGTGTTAQTWMAENLNVGTRVAGKLVTNNQSDDTKIEKYCYDDLEANCTTDGGLYQWAEAMAFKCDCNSTAISDATCNASIATGHHQGICPAGWHVPKPEEWAALTTFLGGTSVAGKTLKLNNTGNATWDASTNNDGNSSGFSALPAGYRHNGGDGFYVRGSNALFWDAAEDKASEGNRHVLFESDQTFTPSQDKKVFGYSVRCVKND